MVALIKISIVNFFSEITIIVICQEREHTGLLDCKNPFTIETVFLRELCSSVNYSLRQVPEISFIIDNKLEFIVLSQYILTKVNGQYRYLLVKLFQAVLIRSLQECTISNKTLIKIFEKEFLFGIQIKT